MPRTLWLAILREVLLYSALGGIVVTFFFVAGNAPRYASDLVAVGFAGSDVLVLVLSAEIFHRPWCLLEVLTAIREGVPIVAVGVGSTRTARRTMPFS